MGVYISPLARAANKLNYKIGDCCRIMSRHPASVRSNVPVGGKGGRLLIFWHFIMGINVRAKAAGIK